MKKAKLARCPHCFSLLKNGAGDCPTCAALHKRDILWEGREPLPCGYALSAQICLGVVVEGLPDSLLYAAWDGKKRRRLLVREYFPAGQAHRDSKDGCTLLFNTAHKPEGKLFCRTLHQNGTQYILERDRLDRLLRHTRSLLKQEAPITYQAAICTMQGMREKQEDAAQCMAGRGFAYAVLCDGMGGMGNGEIASGHTAARYFMLYPAFTTMPEEEIFPSLQALAQQVDGEICALRNANGQPLHCGSTLVCVVVREDRMYAFHLGDSRLYRLRKGQIERLTHDHVLYYELQRQVERGELSQQEMDAHPKKEALTQYIGSGQNIPPIQAEAMLFEENDIVLLCSDGVYRTLGEERILHLLPNDDMPLERSVHRLLQAVQDEHLPNQDNATAILIRRAPQERN